MTALVIASVAVKEGRESWQGESFCTAPMFAGAEAPGDACGCEDDCCD